MKKLSILILLVLLSAGVAATARPAKKKMCVSPSQAQQFLQTRQTLTTRAGIASVHRLATAGNVVVLEADPALLIVPNPFDLKQNTIRFTPAPNNHFAYSLIPYSFNASAGTIITLKDDDSAALTFQSFAFPFEGKFYSGCYVNSNGNITFEQGDPDPPNIDSLISGPPRIAPFFADLDPENSGTVFVTQSADTVIITWLKVPEFYNQNQFDYGANTFQIVLYRDGRIDLIYSSDMTATQALVGVVRGNGKSQLRLVDYSQGTLQDRPAGTLIENFRDYESADIPAVMRTFYSKYGDKYDFVTLFSNFDVTPVPSAQAFAINVQNDVKGIGNPSARGRAIFRNTAQYGSAGKLQNITFFGNIHQYPSNPYSPLPDTYTSPLQMLAHEVGHRWLSYVNIIQDGASSDLLLGRDLSHWSFFYDSNGSFLEGNQILQKSQTSFLTSTPFTGYSSMDLYLMGLIAATDVQPSYVVLGPSNFSPSFPFSAESAPEPGVSFRGSARPVSVNDVIAANGARSPDVTTSQKTFNHVFVLIVKSDTPATADEIAAVDQLRAAWEGYFSAATGGKGKMQTNVQ